MNANTALISELLGEFAESFDIEGIDMELFQRGLTIESDEFWEIVAEFDIEVE